MDDLISRAALLARFKTLQECDPEHEGRGWACNFLNDSREPSIEWYCVESVAEDMPAVDAIPVSFLQETMNKLQYAFQNVEADHIAFVLWLWNRKKDADRTEVSNHAVD